MFLGFSNLHKGFKCLEVASGRVYISHDVIFDENVFPFSALHSNASAWLRAKISLLPSFLLNPASSDQGGDEHVTGHMSNSPIEVVAPEITDNFDGDFTGNDASGTANIEEPIEVDPATVTADPLSASGAGASSSTSVPSEERATNRSTPQTQCQQRRP